MHYLLWFDWPYRELIQPHFLNLLYWTFGLSLAAALLDLILPSSGRQRGRLTLILAVINILLYQSQFMNGRKLVDVWAVAIAAAFLGLYGLIYRQRLREEWEAHTLIPNFWIGLVIITAITLVKLIELEPWPPFLNEYSANTGIWGMEAIEGQWPEFPLQGRGFDLRGGGVSPLMLPVMWLIMKFYGVNAFSVRLTEVAGSTVLLLFFWDFLRRNIPGIWSSIALIVFGLSPWHMAQSRMGTFFSISTAVSIGTLWSADRIFRTRSTGTASGWWIMLGIFSGCIGWAYAPMKVLYPFFFVVVAGIPLLTRQRTGRRWLGPILALAVFGLLFGIQFQGLKSAGEMFQSHFGNLATDNPVWRKSVDDVVGNQRQPPAVVLRNIGRNAVEWVRVTFQEPTILRVYPGALIMSLVMALLLLRRHPVLTLYYFCGLLPSLLIFPLHRRALIIWPLVYACAVILLREAAVQASALFRHRMARRIFPAFLMIAIALIMLHGFHLWVTTWSIVKDHSYFGPARRLEAMNLARDLMGSHDVVFINPWVHGDVITITLYERNRELGGDALKFAGISENSRDLRSHVNPYKPTAFFFFDLDRQTWLKQKLLRELPGGVLQEFHNSGGRRELLYSVYTLPIGIMAGRTGEAQAVAVF